MKKVFYIVMNYIVVEDPEVAKERAKIRVSKGGHGIPDKDIERRYYDSQNNLLFLYHEHHHRCYIGCFLSSCYKFIFNIHLHN